MHTARATSGQTLSINYDAVTNTVQIREYDWFAEPLRQGAMPVTSPAIRWPQPVAAIRRRRQWLRTGRAA